MSILSGRMDGQQEREAALTRESVEDILRPLTEATVEDVRPDEPPFPRIVLLPDPRFEALRVPYGDLEVVGEWGGVYHKGGIGASMRAILDSAKACGDEVLRAVYSAMSGAMKTAVLPDGSLSTIGDDRVRRTAARALVAAWKGKKP